MAPVLAVGFLAKWRHGAWELDRNPLEGDRLVIMQGMRFAFEAVPHLRDQGCLNRSLPAVERAGSKTASRPDVPSNRRISPVQAPGSEMSDSRVGLGDGIDVRCDLLCVHFLQRETGLAW